MSRRTGVLLCCAILLTTGLGALATVASAKPAKSKKVSKALEGWPSWRGPLNTGVSPQGDPPVEWSETKNVRWKTKLPGSGHASPIVWGDRIYVLSAIRTEREVQGRPDPERPTHVYQFVVLAVDRSSGEIVWQTVVREEVPHEPGHETASQASASPVTDGKHVYAFFGSRGLYCLDKNGKVRWEADLGDMTTRNQFGEGASPLLHGNTLVVNWDHEGESFVAAFDKRNGKRLWKVDRDEPTSWSTPIVVTDSGRDLVVISATNRVRAYDMRTGDEVWECAGLGLNCVPVPVEDAGTLFVMSGYRDPAGMAIRYAGAKGDISGSDRVLWRIESGTSYVPSPLLAEGKLYFLERFKGMLSSYDLRTGEVQYEKQRLGELGNIYASPVAASGRMYFVDRNGNAIVVRLGADVEILAQNRLDDTFDASPAVAGNDLILRGHENLYCLAQ